MNEKLAQDVVDSLKKAKLRVAFAESCTGGMLAAAITSVPGASEVMELSVVTYSNWSKVEYTDVTQEVLNTYGTVSSQTALLMAQGIKTRSGANIGVGITGIAGPSGGSYDIPVGTVYIAVVSENNTVVKHFTFSGKSRRGVCTEATKQALIMLNRDYGHI